MLESICGSCDGVRREADGTVWLTKDLPPVEAILDLTMTRVRPGERRWIPKPYQDLDAMRGVHSTCSAVVLGKGPSLTRWLRSPSPTKCQLVVGINEAALLYPCRYAFALDDGVFENLRSLNPNTILAMEPRRVVSCPHGRKLIWEWGKHAKPGYATAPVAISVMRLLGVKNFLMVGFDGYDAGAEYAGELRLPPRDGDNYSVINQQLDEQDVDYEWYHRQQVVA